jgi:hypothetical protein
MIDSIVKLIQQGTSIRKKPFIEEWNPMLSKCANPSCSKEFHYFGEGKVFEIRWETSPGATHSHGKKRKHIEHYWLCSSCSHTLTIAMDSASNILVIRRPNEPNEDADRAIA